MAADDAQISLAVIGFLSPDAIGFGNRVIFIDQKRKRQIEFGLEVTPGIFVHFSFRKQCLH